MFKSNKIKKMETEKLVAPELRTLIDVLAADAIMSKQFKADFRRGLKNELIPQTI